MKGTSRHTVDSTHDESYLCGISCACEMGVNLFGFGLVEGDKSVEDVIASRSIIRTT